MKHTSTSAHIPGARALLSSGNLKEEVVAAVVAAAGVAAVTQFGHINPSLAGPGTRRQPCAWLLGCLSPPYELNDAFPLLLPGYAGTITAAVYKVNVKAAVIPADHSCLRW